MNYKRYLSHPNKQTSVAQGPFKVGHKEIWWWGSSNAVAFGNAEYPSFSSPIWTGVVAPDSVLSMDQTELFDI